MKKTARDVLPATSATGENVSVIFQERRHVYCVGALHTDMAMRSSSVRKYPRDGCFAA